ncbi:TetR/AcrR family transcriptional regulator [uncultured Dubosiella sp.]|nr:TetR/AcrR family transcriptional regulator [uncultured Dubosiella sp.]
MLDDPKSQTRFYLRKAFYECLAQDAPLTITRLCDQAGVGRRTFYRHYDGLDGVFADCLEQLLTRYRDAVSPLRTYDLEQIATEFFSFWKQQKKELLLLRRYDAQKLNYGLLSGGIRLVQARSNHRFALFSTYSAGGFLALLNEWIEEDMRTPVDQLVSRLVSEARSASFNAFASS